MRIISTVVLAIMLVVLGVMAFAWSGLYNIAANVHHYAWTLEFLDMARDRSIEYHSKSVEIVPSKDPAIINEGMVHFHAMCRLCHGAPGFARSQFALGLYPSPPSLVSEDVKHDPDNEVFWVIRNGIKLTGMPAFSVSHDDQQIVGILSALRKVQSMTPDEYKKMIQAMPQDHAKEHEQP